MPIIVLEGPDESGKTTLATKLRDTLEPVIDTEYQRSPVREHGWSEQYNNYLINQSRAIGHLLVQDRIPEISESVYGFMRGEPRTHGWVYEAGDWFHQPIFMVFCEGPGILQTTHKDAEGLAIAHAEVALLYDYTYWLLEQTSIMARMTEFKVVKYNRFSDDQSEFFWSLLQWLTFCFPHRRVEFVKAVAPLIERNPNEL